MIKLHCQNKTTDILQLRNYGFEVSECLEISKNKKKFPSKHNSE